MSEHIWLDTAMKQAIGTARLPDIKSKIKKQLKKGTLIREEPLYLSVEKTNAGQGKIKQKWATELMTSTTNRIIGIQGFAGTGKSHMLKAAKAIIESGGYHIHALSHHMKDKLRR